MSPTEEESEEERQFFHSGWRDEEERIDVYALFVLEDVPVAVSRSSSRARSRKLNAKS